MAPGFGPVTITAKVIRRASGVKLHSVRGRMVAKQSVYVADSTGGIEVAVWSDLIEQVDVGSTYTFSDLTVRRFHVTSVTTTVQTVVMCCDEVLSVNEAPIEEEAASKTMDVDEVLQFRCNSVSSCGSCHKMISEVGENVCFVKCTVCGMRQKVKNLAVKYSCIMNAKMANEVKKLVIHNPVLTDFFDKEGLEFTDNDSIEEYFLVCSKLRITVIENEVTDMCIKGESGPVTGGEPSGSVVALMQSKFCSDLPVTKDM
ncbi:uncharacterized protein [Ptychodera flava]|uniref:uncharacterized protein n=1 Tax=Ptychodera flava TaxID=63121 RepID=UPI00396A4BE2